MALPHGAMGWSAVCDYGIFGSYLLFVSIVLIQQSKIIIKLNVNVLETVQRDIDSVTILKVN